MLTLLWLLTLTAVLVAVLALVKARRATKRLERLTETYWELRYDHGQLRARVEKLNPEEESGGQPGAAPKEPGGANFIPLSSLKR